jgi:hypothetical protein
MYKLIGRDFVFTLAVLQRIAWFVPYHKHYLHLALKENSTCKGVQIASLGPVSLRLSQCFVASQTTPLQK